MHKGYDEFSVMLHIKDANEVEAEVRCIVAEMFPDFDFSLFSAAYGDVIDLFEGRYPGYRGCNTEYHDLGHTLDVVLATARLAHGVHLSRERLTPDMVRIALVAALFHDAGYIQSVDDRAGTGAKYTLTHVERSVDFMRAYARARGCGQEFERACAAVIRTTDLSREIEDIDFPDPAVLLLGWIVGTADVVGQMADRIYLEKLPLLYQEFYEAGMGDFDSEYDLLRKTLGFYKFMRFRMEHHLGDVKSCMAAHFKARFGKDEDLYALYIRKNMEFLQNLLTKHGRQICAKLRNPDK